MNRRTLALVAALSLAVSAGCYTTDTRYNHWRLEGLTPRIAYHVLRYDTNTGVPYRRVASQQRQDINLTIRRHLLNDNPYNPFKHDNAYVPPQKVFSPLPDPIHFFHLSSLAFAGALLGAGGPFIPFPIEVIPVMFEDGGAAEMWGGITSTFKGENYLARQPPPNEEFEVKHR